MAWFEDSQITWGKEGNCGAELGILGKFPGNIPWGYGWEELIPGLNPKIAPLPLRELRIYKQRQTKLKFNTFTQQYWSKWQNCRLVTRVNSHLWIESVLYRCWVLDWLSRVSLIKTGTWKKDNLHWIIEHLGATNHTTNILQLCTWFSNFSCCNSVQLAEVAVHLYMYDYADKI